MSRASAVYDPEADAIAVRFAPADSTYVESEEVAPGVVLDDDAKGRVIGVELLDVRALLAAGNTRTEKAAAAE